MKYSLEGCSRRQRMPNGTSVVGRRLLYYCLCLLFLFANPVYCTLSSNTIIIASKAVSHTATATVVPRGGGFFGGNDDAAADIETATPAAIILSSKLYSLTAVCYGTLLMVYGHQVPSQLQALTVLRIAGFPRFQQALSDLKENIQQTKRAVWRHGPSLYHAQKSIQQLHQRSAEARSVMAKTRAARADGIVTIQEEYAIKKLQQRQLQSIRKDMRRIQRGSNALQRLWDTLDLDEIWEVFEDFLFLATAVVASGNDNFIGLIFAKYCYWMNLGSLLLDMSTKFQFPISKLVLRLIPFLPDPKVVDTITAGSTTTTTTTSKTKSKSKKTSRSDKRMEKDLMEITSVTAVIINYALAAYLVFFQYDEGITLNSALMVALILLRGLEGLLFSKKNTNNTKKKKHNNKQKGGAILVDGPHGGIWMLSFTLLALGCSGLVHKKNLPLPEWMGSLEWVEEVVGEIVQATRIAGKL